MRYEKNIDDIKSIKELPVNDRPREKLLSVGPLGLSDVELVCLILGSGNRGRTVQSLAQDILALMDSKGSSGLTTQDIASIPGIGAAKAASICACLELGRRFSFNKARPCKDPLSVFEIVRHYGDRPQEHFIEILLNGAYELMGVNLVTVGLVNRTLVHPREVFAEPLKARATAIILAHNHPSGNLESSPDDLDITFRMRKAGKLLGIDVLDHIIFSSDNYHSLMESGELI